jgi:hypothetical protein
MEKSCIKGDLKWEPKTIDPAGINISWTSLLKWLNGAHVKELR